MINLYQIFYNAETERQVPACCIGLDNTNPQEGGWFEFMPIVRCLQGQAINSDDFYGFLSPNFEAKTGLTPNQLLGIVERNQNEYNAFISNYCWDQTAFFKNAWDQGEFWHPGITKHTQNFLDYCGINQKVEELIGCEVNTVASNFIVAKGDYWKKWLELSLNFINFINESLAGQELANLKVTYATQLNKQRMAVFIQERFASLILSTSHFKTYTVDTDLNTIIFEPLFANTRTNMSILRTLDQLKRFSLEFSDPRLLRAWAELRPAVQLNLSVSR